MRKILVMAYLLSLLSGPGLIATPPPSARLEFPDIAHAAITGTEGVILNPASLFLNKPFGVIIYHTYAQGEFSGDNAALVSIGGLGFGYQKLSLGYPESVTRYDFAVSSRIMRNLYTGLSYTSYNTDFLLLQNTHAWNLSLLYHLSRQASLSAQLLNLNRQRTGAERSATGYLVSGAIRPLNERLTLGANLLFYGGQKIKDATWRLTGRMILRSGLILYGGWGENKSFGIGLELHFGEFLAGGGNFYRNNKYQRTTIYGGSSKSTRANLIKPRGKILRVTISGTIPEEKHSPFFLQTTPATFYRRLEKIRMAANDPAIKGLLLVISSPQLGWGQLSDLRQTILDFKQKGKPVISFLGTSPGDGSYYLASAADSILMLPVDALLLDGIGAEVKFLAGTLDKLGIEPEIEKAGKYKNAPNRYTETDLTPEHREALAGLLDDLFADLLAASDKREFTPDQFEKLIDRGPFTSVQAESLGLVDGRLYPGKLNQRLPQLFGGNRFLIDEGAYKKNREFSGRFGEKPAIALIAISGTIANGNSGSNLIFGKVAGAKTINAAIRYAAGDPRVKAIVVRLDTPGGNAIASDLIWGELRAATEKKPVIVSMSNVCASGGYYIAAAADEIYLQPNTITGSIGVYYGKVNLKRLYDKIGVSSANLRRGRHATMYSFSRPFSDEERTIIRKQIDDLYKNFISVVAEGRGLSVDSVAAIAQGRVWSGTQALKLGLADKSGSLLDAIDAAASRAGIGNDDYDLIELPRQRSLPRFLSLLFGSGNSIINSTGTNLLGKFTSLTNEQIGAGFQYRLSYQLEIK